MSTNEPPKTEEHIGKPKKSWKFKTILIALIFIVLIIGILGIAVMNLDTLIEKNRDLIVQQVEGAVGRKVEIGDLKTSIWGGGRIQLKGITIADNPVFSDKAFFEAEEFVLQVEILPLLRKELRFNELTIRKPHIVLIRDKGGQLNVSTLAQPNAQSSSPGESGDKPEEPQSPKTEAEEKATTPSFSIRDITVEDGTLEFRDLANGAQLAVNRLQINVSGTSSDNPTLNARISAAVFSDNENIKISGKLGPIDDFAAIQKAAYEGDVSLVKFDTGKLQSALKTMQIELPLPPELTFEGPLSVDLQVRSQDKGIHAKGNIEATENTIQYAGLFNKPSKTPLNLKMDVALNPDKVNITSSDLALADSKIHASGDLSFGQTPLNVNMKLSSNQTNLTGLDALLPILAPYKLKGQVNYDLKIEGPIDGSAVPQTNGTIELRDVETSIEQLPKPLTAIVGNIDLKGDTIEIKNLQARTGETAVELKADIKRGQTITANYTLKSDALHLPDLMAEPQQSSPPDVIKNFNVTGNATLNGDAPAKTPSIAAQITSSDGSISGFAYKTLHADTQLENDIAVLKDLGLEVFEGAISANGQYALSKQMPDFQAQAKVQGLNIQKYMLTSDPGNNKPIQGLLDFETEVTGKGVTPDAIQTNLKGTYHTEVRDGKIEGVNIVQTILGPFTKIPGLSALLQPVAKNDLTDILTVGNTTFSKMESTGAIGNAKVNIQSFEMAAQDWSIHGDGWVGFNKKIDTKAVLTLSPRFVTAITHSIKEVEKVTEKDKPAGIPFVVKGTLPDVKPVPDVKSAVMIFPNLLGGAAGEIGDITKGILNTIVPGSDKKEESTTESTEEKKEDPISGGLRKIFGR